MTCTTGMRTALAKSEDRDVALEQRAEKLDRQWQLEHVDKNSGWRPQEAETREHFAKVEAGA